jgi:hypothetical protein
MASGKKNAALAADDRRPAVQDTVKIGYATMPLHFKLMSAAFHTFQQPATQPGRARLITIGYSHYVDRVRWVLDLSPLGARPGGSAQYTEDVHPPGLCAAHPSSPSPASRSHSQRVFPCAQEHVRGAIGHSWQGFVDSNTGAAGWRGGARLLRDRGPAGRAVSAQ